MSGPRQPSACVVVIGNEILSGRTRDANVQFLAKALGELGIRVLEVRVVPDDADAIAGAVNTCRALYDHVFTTGGIGPTHDDITAASVAKAFGVGLRRHPQALARLQRYYRPEDLNEARLRMSDVPEGADLIDNPISQSPGFRLGNVFVLAGVPLIAQAMFDCIRPHLRGGPPTISRAVTAYVREGDIAAGLSGIQDRIPGVDIGSYPFFRDGRLGVTVVARGVDAHLVDAAATAVTSLLRDTGGDPLALDLAGDETG